MLIRDVIAETELGKIGVVKALFLVLNQFPEFFDIYPSCQFCSRLFGLFQRLKQFRPGHLGIDRRAGHEEGPFGRKIHFPVCRRQKMEPGHFILKAEGDAEVPAINVFYDLSLMHLSPS